MDSVVKTVAASVVRFLTQQLAGGALGADARDTLRACVQRLEAAFQLAPGDAARAVDLLALMRVLRPAAPEPAERPEPEQLREAPEGCAHAEADDLQRRQIEGVRLQVSDDDILEAIRGVMRDPTLMGMLSDMIVDRNVQDMLMELTEADGVDGAAGGRRPPQEGERALAQYIRTAYPGFEERLERRVRRHMRRPVRPVRRLERPVRPVRPPRQPRPPRQQRHPRPPRQQRHPRRPH